VRATLHDLPGVFDFSNVDLVNFQYFKNLASQDPRTAANANPFLEHFVYSIMLQLLLIIL